MKVVFPNLLCEQWRARTWCSSPKCPESDLSLRICRKRTSYRLRLIDHFAHNLPTSTLLENIHVFICKHIYCIFKYICATTPSSYHWSKNTSSNWNIVCRSCSALWKTKVLIPMCICIWVIDWSDKANNHYPWWLRHRGITALHPTVWLYGGFHVAGRFDVVALIYEAPHVALDGSSASVADILPCLWLAEVVLRDSGPGAIAKRRKWQQQKRTVVTPGVVGAKEGFRQLRFNSFNVLNASSTMDATEKVEQVNEGSCLRNEEEWSFSELHWAGPAFVAKLQICTQWDHTAIV